MTSNTFFANTFIKKIFYTI